MKFWYRRIINICLICFGIFVLPLAYGEQNSTKSEYEILLLPSAHAEIRPDAEHSEDSDHDEFEVKFATSAAFSWKYKKVRSIGEAVISSHHSDLERLQIGWESSQNGLFWVGKLHTPLGYWNTEYHHGLHLQSSLHRPSIVEYEDDGGVLPNHVIGVMYQNKKYIDDAVLSLDLSFGSVAKIEDRKFNSFALNSFKQLFDSKHFTARVSIQPNELEENKYGVFLSQSDIPAESNLENVIQQIIGAYAHGGWGRFTITTAGFYVRNKINYTTTSRESRFYSQYIHGEYQLARNWIIYSRWEYSRGTEADEYLATLDHIHSDKILTGVRWDFSRRQAIGAEISNSNDDNNSHSSMSIQWSAVFP